MGQGGLGWIKVEWGGVGHAVVWWIKVVCGGSCRVGGGLSWWGGVDHGMV